MKTLCILGVMAWAFSAYMWLLNIIFCDFDYANLVLVILSITISIFFFKNSAYILESLKKP